MVRLVLVAVPQVKKFQKKNITLRLSRRPHYFFTPPIEREKLQEISPFENFDRLSNYAIPQASSEKCVQASDPEDTTLATSTVDYEFQPTYVELRDTDVCNVRCTRETIHLNALKERPSRLY